MRVRVVSKLAVAMVGGVFAAVSPVHALTLDQAQAVVDGIAEGCVINKIDVGPDGFYEVKADCAGGKLEIYVAEDGTLLAVEDEAAEAAAEAAEDAAEAAESD